jgi:serine/threonine-protein kinase
MAPEQAFSSDQASVQSDLYSVGVILYEMLSGVLPAQGDMPLVVAQQVLTGKVKPLQELCPGLPQGLVNLIQRAMQPDASQRPESALWMRRELSVFAGALSAAGRLASVVLRETPPPGGVTAGGTQKVPAISSSAVVLPAVVRPVAVSPVGQMTAEMSQFGAAVPAPLAPRRAHTAAAAPAAIAAAPAAKAAAASPALAPPALAPPAAVPAPAALPAPAVVPAPAAAQRAPLPPTAEMPRVEGARALPATVPTSDPPPGGRKRRSSLWLWLTLCTLLVGAGLGGLWLLQVMSDPGPPPPMPMPRGFQPSRPAATQPAATTPAAPPAQRP